MLYVQYQKSTNLQKLLTELEPILTIDKNLFIRDYIDITTATSDGLDNWGLILNQSRGIEVNSTDIDFGFYNGTSPFLVPPKNFNRGVFYKDRLNTLSNLTDPAYRHLLIFVYASQNTICTLGAANALVNFYYQSIDTAKKVIVSENEVQPMSILYKFNFKLQGYETTIYSLNGVLPRPTGCLLSLLDNQSF